MILQEEGKLSVDDPVEKHLPEFRGQRIVSARDGDSVTLKKPSRIITLRRVDMKRASVKASATRRLQAGTGEEYFAVVGPLVEELFPDYPLRANRQRGVSDAVVARRDGDGWNAKGTATSGAAPTASSKRLD